MNVVYHERWVWDVLDVNDLSWPSDLDDMACLPRLPRPGQRWWWRHRRGRANADCCWWHSDSWSTATETAIDLIRKHWGGFGMRHRTSHQQNSDLVNQIRRDLAAAGLSAWQRQAVGSLIQPADAIDPSPYPTGELRYTNGRHRSAAMIHTGVRRVPVGSVVIIDTELDLRMLDADLVVLIGAPGSGKSHLASTLPAGDVVGLDQMRALISGDENDQTATPAAVDLLHKMVDARLQRRVLTVVDATNTVPAHRRRLLKIAARHRVTAAAAVVVTDLDVTIARNAARPSDPDQQYSRRVPETFVRSCHDATLALTPYDLVAEGFGPVRHYTSE